MCPSKPTIEVKCSLINQCVKKQNRHGMSSFNESSVHFQFNNHACQLCHMTMVNANLAMCALFFFKYMCVIFIFYPL